MLRRGLKFLKFCSGGLVVDDVCGVNTLAREITCKARGSAAVITYRVFLPTPTSKNLEINRILPWYMFRNLFSGSSQPVCSERLPSKTGSITHVHRHLINHLLFPSFRLVEMQRYCTARNVSGWSSPRILFRHVNISSYNSCAVWFCPEERKESANPCMLVNTAGCSGPRTLFRIFNVSSCNCTASLIRPSS